MCGTQPKTAAHDKNESERFTSIPAEQRQEGQVVDAHQLGKLGFELLKSVLIFSEKTVQLRGPGKQHIHEGRYWHRGTFSVGMLDMHATFPHTLRPSHTERIVSNGGACVCGRARTRS